MIGYLQGEHYHHNRPILLMGGAARETSCYSCTMFLIVSSTIEHSNYSCTVYHSANHLPQRRAPWRCGAPDTVS